MVRRLIAIVLLTLAFEAVAAERQRAIGRSAPPLDPRVLEQLRFIHQDHVVTVRAGRTQQLVLGTETCCYIQQPVTANVRWSIEPRNWHASIDQKGVLTIDPDAPDGAGYRVYANIEGRRIISTDVHVYRPEENPIVAMRGFRQVGEIACGGSGEIEPVRGAPIESLRVHGDGSFDLVWRGFEKYKDYWGFFTILEDRMTLGVRFGNHVPADFDGDGTYELVKVGDPEVSPGGEKFQRYHLILRNIWLGRTRGDTTPAGCGVVLEGWLVF